MLWEFGNSSVFFRTPVLFTSYCFGALNITVEKEKTYPPQLKSVLLLAVKHCDLEHGVVKEKRPFCAFFPIYDLKHGAVKKNRPFSAFLLIFDLSSF